MTRPLLNRRLHGLGTAGRTQVRFAFCKREEILEEALSRLEVLAT